MSAFTPVGPKPTTSGAFTPVSNSSVPTQSYSAFTPVQQEEPELERSWSRAFGDTGAAVISGVPRAAAGGTHDGGGLSARQLEGNITENFQRTAAGGEVLADRLGVECFGHMLSVPLGSNALCGYRACASRSGRALPA